VGNATSSQGAVHTSTREGIYRVTDDRFHLPHPDAWSITSGDAAERMRAVAEATRGFPSLLMLDAAVASVRTPVEQTGYASEVVAQRWAGRGRRWGSSCCYVRVHPAVAVCGSG
jgi:hypothetical protein